MEKMIQAIGFTNGLPIADEESLRDVRVPMPSPGPRDLIVEVRAVSVNPVDVKVRASAGPSEHPKVIGYDAAGIVHAVGSETELFRPGDRVYYAGSIGRPGTNVAYHAVDERIVGRMPSSLSYPEAAALPLTTITAWETLFDRLRLTRESTGTLLVVGATGGVGSMILQLSRELLPGITLIATASRQEGAEWVTGLGAHHVVNHREDLAAQVAAIAPGGVDYLFTAHSEGQLEAYAGMVRPFGEIVAIDDPKHADVSALKSKSIAWHWELMFTRALYGTDDMVAQHELLGEVADLVDAGRVRSTVTQILHPMAAASLRRAHELIEGGRTIGKIVIDGGGPATT